MNVAEFLGEYKGTLYTFYPERIAGELDLVAPWLDDPTIPTLQIAHSGLLLPSAEIIIASQGGLDAVLETVSRKQSSVVLSACNDNMQSLPEIERYARLIGVHNPGAVWQEARREFSKKKLIVPDQVIYLDKQPQAGTIRVRTRLDGYLSAESNQILLFSRKKN